MLTQFEIRLPDASKGFRNRDFLVYNTKTKRFFEQDEEFSTWEFFMDQFYDIWFRKNDGSFEKLDSKDYQICRNSRFWGYAEINGKKESFDVYEHDQIISEDEEGHRYEGIVTLDGCSFFLETKDDDAIPLCDLVATRTIVLGTTLGEKGKIK
jgi:hypothetical protein